MNKIKKIFDELDLKLCPEDKLYLRNGTISEGQALHFSLGRYMRNTFSLWHDIEYVIDLIDEIKENYPDDYDYYVNKHFAQIGLGKLNEIKPTKDYNNEKMAESIYFPDQVSGILILLYQNYLKGNSLNKQIREWL